MRFVYILQHVYYYGKNNEHREEKFLGVFSTKLRVKEAIMHYVKLPGFNEYSLECFEVNKYKIGKMEWTDGFIDTKKPNE